MSSSVGVGGPGPRPRQVTLGGWVIAVASAMLVVSVFDSMAGLHSVQTRDAVTRAITSGSGRGLGITVSEALGIMRGALFVAGVGAAVTGVLGIFVLQRHAAARVVLTIAAVPVVLTAPFSGGVLGLLIGVATASLWSRPARDWFAGRPPTPVATVPATARSRTSTAVHRPAPHVAPGQGAGLPDRPGGDGSAPPPPTLGWGRPASPESWPPPYAAPPAGPAAPVSPRGVSPQVPGPVRLACVLTWVFSLVTAALYLLVGTALLVDRAGMLDLLRDNPTVRDTRLTEDQLVTAIVGVSAVVVLWCLAACVLAALVWRRHAWAWVLLVVSTGFAALVEIVVLPFSLLHLAAAGVALRMLLTRPSRAWFRHDRTPSSGWAPPQGPPAGPPDRPDEPSGKPPVW